MFLRRVHLRNKPQRARRRAAGRPGDAVTCRRPPAARDSNFPNRRARAFLGRPLSARRTPRCSIRMRWGAQRGRLGGRLGWGWRAGPVGAPDGSGASRASREASVPLAHPEVPLPTSRTAAGGRPCIRVSSLAGGGKCSRRQVVNVCSKWRCEMRCLPHAQRPDSEPLAVGPGTCDALPLPVVSDTQSSSRTGAAQKL